MCKASHEPGGPQRCSGDSRVSYQRSTDEVARLEARAATLRAQLGAEVDTRGLPAVVVDTLVGGIAGVRKLKDDRAAEAALGPAFRRACEQTEQILVGLAAKPVERWTVEDQHALRLASGSLGELDSAVRAARRANTAAAG